MISTEEIREVLETNLLGPMLVSKHTLPLLLKRRGRRIVNVSSLVGAMTTPPPLTRTLPIGGESRHPKPKF